MRILAFLAMMLMTAQKIWAVGDTQVFAVGSNRSLDQRLETLKFAEEDASRFSEAMTKVGLVAALRSQTLAGPSLGDFKAEFEKSVRQSSLALQSKREITKFIFYFSGHADEHGLHFKDGILTKKGLHAMLGRVRARTKVAILDSCFSGSLSAKGVRPSKSFELPKMEFDEPTGSVFLTASSSDQYSFESDRFKSSIFTHHLLIGLYGDGDANADGVVTIDELYQYVYRNTKWHSLNLPIPTSQEPGYVAKLKGRGAIALSFPLQTTAELQFGSDIGGDVTIASIKGLQFFKLPKSAGAVKNLRLPAGSYRILVRNARGLGSGKASLITSEAIRLDSKDLVWKKYASTAPLSKGSIAAPVKWKPASDPAQDSNEHLVIAGMHSGFVEKKTAPYVGYAHFWQDKASRGLVMGVGGLVDYHQHEPNDDILQKQSVSSVNLLFKAAFGRRSRWHIFTGGGPAYVQQTVKEDSYRPDTESQGATVAQIKNGIVLDVGVSRAVRAGIVVQVDFLMARKSQASTSRTSANGGSAALVVRF